MLYIYLGIAIILLVLLLFYTYLLIRRILGNIFPNKKIKLFSLVLAILLYSPLSIKPLSLWFIFIFYLIIISLIIDLINLFLRRYGNNIWEKVYVFLIIPILLSSLITIYSNYNAGNIIKSEYNITSEKKLSRNYRVGLIADLHFGNVLTLEKLKTQIEKISNENLDILVLAGDIVDELTEVSDYNEIFKILGSIKTKYGIYYVHGNHDESRYSNPTDDRNIKLLDAIKAAEIKFLNETSEIINEDLIISGRIDYSYNSLGLRKKSVDIIDNLDKSKFIIVADHQPYYYKENKDAGFDLQVSGHTHAGQIWPFGLITRSIGFDYGYLQENKFNLVVTSGLGVWGYPARTEEHAEYVVINVKNK